MPPGSGPRLQHAALLYIFILSLVVAAQQQQPSSLPQSLTQGGKKREGILRNHSKNKDTAAYIASNERALATFAPEEDLVPSVRAPLAPPTGASSGVSRQSARSLQDWQVEDIILLATVDGKIYARDRTSGASRWELEVDRPMVETTYHTTNKSTDGAPGDDDVLWIVEPRQDGALYLYSPVSGMGMQRLPLTVRKLVDELSPYYNDEEPPVVYTADKKVTVYTIDASNGNILRMFSTSGSVINNDRSCRRVNALESIDQECEPIGTLTLGRTEYTVRIQDRNTGDPICTISYFEWSSNSRDQDLHQQYSNTLDNRYVYSKHDGSIMALQHSQPDRRGRHTSGGQSLVFSHKFPSPVARVYDVIRPHNAEARDANLVVLPQPVGPVNEDWPALDNIFVNRTESGSWYALSERSYPLVTDGASRAQCYTQGIYMPHMTVGGDIFEQQKDKLVGVHPLSDLGTHPHSVPAIGPPDANPPSVAPPKSTLGKDQGLAEYQASDWKSSLPSPVTLMAILLGLWAIPQVRSYLQKMQSSILKTKELEHPVEMPDISVDIKPVTDESAPETMTEKVSISFENSKSDADLTVRVPEPAEETIFPQLPKNDVDDLTAISTTPVRQPTPDSAAEASETAAPDDQTAGAESSPVKKEKKARRGVRGGRKLKEKKLEQEQAQQRRRANSQTKTNSVSFDMPKIVEDVPETPVESEAVQVVNVDSPPESLNVSGKIQINHLIVDTNRLIGRGSAGTCVFEGTFDKRSVAVKRMVPQYYELASQEVELLQENDDHKNVIRYFCQEKDRDFLYIAVELCQGSLWDSFNPAGFEAEKQTQLDDIKKSIQQDVRGALREIVLGLRHLHDRRIIHRDIKPQNILIGQAKARDTRPRLLISDFGLCKTLPENASTLIDPTGNAGTCGWKAPEVISQTKDTASQNGHSTSSAMSDNGAAETSGGVKRAADIFSLGCLFFWVLTEGNHPFDDDSGWAVAREYNIKKNDMQNMHKLDMGADTEEPMQLIREMLAHNPEDRPKIEEILSHPFFWSSNLRLQFLCDVSDHFEREPRDPPSIHLDHLESYAKTVIPKDDFLKDLPKDFKETLGKQRKYTGGRVLDLLRALRNKKNHYEDMPESVMRKVGSLPDGYLSFWTVKFPKLLMACHWVVRECNLQKTERFRQYFETQD